MGTVSIAGGVALIALTALIGTTAAFSASAPVEAPAKLIQRNATLGLEAFPVGFWNHTNLKDHGGFLTEDEVMMWAEAGFTVPMGPAFDPTSPAEMKGMRNLLDWADHYHLRLILRDPRVSGPAAAADGSLVGVTPEQQQAMASAVSDFGSGPGTFGFFIGDEPTKSNLPAYLDLASALQEAAPALHPFINFLPYHAGAEAKVGFGSWPECLDSISSAGGLDFLSYDCYTQMLPGQTGWDLYFENLRLHREAAWRNGVPFWTTLLSVGHYDYRSPSYDELRWQFNTALCSGASGIMWYFYYLPSPYLNFRLAPVDENWTPTITYLDLRRVHLGFHKRYGDLFLHLAPTRVAFVNQVWGNGEAFTSDDLVWAVLPETPGHPLLVGEFVDEKGRPYVMLMNNSTTDSVRVSLFFRGKALRIFSWKGDGKESEGTDPSASRMVRGTDSIRIWHWLAPGQEAMYRVEGTKASVYAEAMGAPSA